MKMVTVTYCLVKVKDVIINLLVFVVNYRGPFFSLVHEYVLPSVLTGCKENFLFSCKSASFRKSFKKEEKEKSGTITAKECCLCTE
jgi:hypothetical protein